MPASLNLLKVALVERAHVAFSGGARTALLRPLTLHLAFVEGVVHDKSCSDQLACGCVLYITRRRRTCPCRYPAPRRKDAKYALIGKELDMAETSTRNSSQREVKGASPIAKTGVVIGDDGLARPPWAAVDPMLRSYYDTEWGMPVKDERGLFERLSLEVFQSGLSWATILRKRDDFRTAFCQFDPDQVASFDDTRTQRLLADPAIVRNRAKILATIGNAIATIKLREDGGLAKFIWAFQPAVTPCPRTVSEIPTISAESTALSKALRGRGFSFVGPTTMHALMEATGIVDTHLIDSHRRGSSGIWPTA